jgi:hypothetical protein
MGPWSLIFKSTENSSLNKTAIGNTVFSQNKLYLAVKAAREIVQYVIVSCSVHTT